jgi:predicted glycosyl hydrolase (DUF1957 family)
MWWINFLHLYQPASIESFVIEEAVKKSYRRLFNLLEKKPGLKMAMNISACLLERLETEGYLDLIDKIKIFVKQGRLELVGSAAFHGFLPRLTSEEIEYQIKYQEKVLKRLFDLNRPAGFFIPEMAYHPKITKIIKKLGYKWLILDEISYNSSEKINYEKCYKDKDTGLIIVFRQRKMSNVYLPDELKRLRRQKNLPAVIITAVDGELYGLRHQDPNAELERIVFWSSLKSATITEFIEIQNNDINVCELRLSSWESTEEELKNNNPFILWDDNNNLLHKKLWQLADLALLTGKKYSRDEGQKDYRWHLNRGLASCWFWWASAYDFTHNYGPLAWSPDQIERGINDLVRAIRSLHNINSLKEKVLAENLVAELRKEIWQNHWQKYWSKTNCL